MTTILRPLKLAVGLLSLLMGPAAYCQRQNGLCTGHQADNWYYGKHHGLSFATGVPVAAPNSQTNVMEGTACLSDAAGGLLFYAAGGTAYNKNHEVMLNGDSLLAGSQSSTQSGIIVPKPGASGIYYLFNVDIHDGLVYSEIDMALDNGNGGITANKNIILDSDARVEKITAVYHQDKQRIWVISHRKANSEFIAYLVSSEGIAAEPVISVTGLQYNTAAPAEGPYVWKGPGGHLKASPDGTRLAAVQDMNGMVEVFDFNAMTGVISSPFQVNIINDCYGLEFSPDSRFLYIPDNLFNLNGNLSSTTVKIFQFDLQAGDPDAVAASAVMVGQYTGRYESALQLGPDGRIYAENSQSLNVLMAIANPNNKGLACGFQPNVLTMIDQDFIGMPNFNQSYFESGILSDERCGGEVAFSLLRIPDVSAVSWNFGDPDSGSDNTSATGFHKFSAPGTYTVTAEITSNGSVQVTHTTVTVNFLTYGTPQDIALCADSQGNATFDLSGQAETVLEGKDASEFIFGYYESLADAENNIDALADPSHFVSSGQTIFIGVTELATNCRTVFEFDVAALPLPALPAELTLKDCEPYDLSEIGNTIEGAVTISYHMTNEDAQAGISPVLSPAHFEPAEGVDTIYLRAENSNGCIKTAPVRLLKGFCDIQKGISPNNDEYNEFFDLADFGVQQLSIFNRYGMEVYHKQGYKDEWHGQDDAGGTLPSGTYYYVIELESESKTGWIYINR